MSDSIRMGLPSASSFALDALCSGRQQLLRELPETPEPADEYRERGVRLHAAWEKGDPTGLDSEDVAIYERGVRLREETFAKWKLDFGLNDEQIVRGENEIRLWYHDSKGELSASGQSDCSWWSKTGHGLIIDYKSLYAKSLVPAERNWQARLLVVLHGKEFGLTKIRFVFLKALWGIKDTVDYTQDDIKRSDWSIEQAIWESRQPEAQRRAGAHCRWCKANTVCPEAAAWVMLPSSQLLPATQLDSNNKVTPTIAKELVAEISLENCVKVFRGITARRNIEDAIKARLKALPSGEQFDLGLKLGKPGSIRVIDPYKAFNFLLGVGVPAERLWTAVKMSNGELTAVLQETLGLDSKKSAEVWIDNKLASCITRVPKEASLEEI